MTVQHLSAQPSFITKGRLDYPFDPLNRTNAPGQNQSLAEARVQAGGRTIAELLQGRGGAVFYSRRRGEIELDGERRIVGPGDAILIPPGAWHAIMATEPLRFLCCCAPPYSHEETHYE